MKVRKSNEPGGFSKIEAKQLETLKNLDFETKRQVFGSISDISEGFAPFENFPPVGVAVEHFFGSETSR